MPKQFCKHYYDNTKGRNGRLVFSALAEF